MLRRRFLAMDEPAHHHRQAHAAQPTRETRPTHRLRRRHRQLAAHHPALAAPQRHSLALDAGVPLRDVQYYARRRDPRTTRRYDHNRTNLDRSVAAYLAEP